LDIRNPRATSLKTTGLIHAVVGADINLPYGESDKFIEFLSTLCQNMKRFSGPLIEAGCRGSDID
jgi:hypothetical protein